MDAADLDTRRTANTHIGFMSLTVPKRYFIIREGRQIGPYSVAKLRELAITPETRVWSEEAFNWVAAASMDELKDVLVQPEQPPAHRGILQWLRR
jgi:hypothetical protein